MGNENENLGFGKTAILGFQHVAVMYGGAVLVPILIGSGIGLTQSQLVYLISFDLFACGIATLIQALGFGRYLGIKLPALMAISFIVVGPAISIGELYSLPGIFGAVIVSGIIVTILAQFAGKLVPFFPPLVTGGVVLIIGVTLMPEAIEDYGGGADAADFGSMQNIGIATFTLLSFLFINHYCKGFIKSIAVLLALVLGTVAASLFGMVDMSVFGEASWVNAITPFYFGVPTFHPSAIITMTLIAIIIMIESVGVFFALGEVSNREIGGHDVKLGLRAEGISAVISGILNSFNHSTFSQNVGLVYLTRVTSRYVVAAGGIILVILGLLPKVAAITTMIPKAVLGGAMIPMFGMLISAALKMMAEDDLSKPSNQLIIGLGIGIGVAVDGAVDVFANVPETIQLILTTGPAMGAIVLFFLNWWFNGPTDHHVKSVNKTNEEKYVGEDKQAISN